MLHSAILWPEGVVPPTADKMTIGDLSNGVDFNNLLLADFLGSYEDNKEMYDILHSVIIWEEGTVPPTADKLTVGHLANGIDFDRYDFDSISLSRFLGDYNSNKEMYDLLHSVIIWEEGTVPPTADKLTVGDLSNGIDFDNLLLQNFLGDYNSNKETYDLLHSIIVWGEGTVPPTADKLTVGDLSNGIDFDNLSLQNFLGNYNSNQKTYDLLHSIIDWEEGATIPTADKLTVGDLSNGINFDNLSLQQVLGSYNDNKLTYDVLCAAVGMGNGEMNYSKLTLAHLKGDVNFNAVPLSVLGLDDSTVNMLLKAVNASIKATEGSPITKDELTITHLKANVFTYIALTDVLPIDGNSQLYSILLQASGVTLTNPSDKNEIAQKAQEITIHSLSSFNMNTVNLSTIVAIEGNEGLYNILSDATGKDANQITVADFASFDATKIHLSTVISSSDNIMLDKLINSGTTIGNLANAIDQLSLYDIYGQNCFVERKAGSTAPAYRYDASQKAYVLDEQGTYEISKSSGIWLLLCFDFDSEDIERENANSIGCARKYTISSATLSALKNGEEGLNITNKITKATIRQLVDAGVLPSANSAIYTLTLESLATWDGFDILGGINA